MDATEVCYLSIAQLAERYRRKELSPVEVTEAYLRRIEALEPRLNSYMTVTGELALEQARVAERELGGGTDRGPLHGVPIALKDLYNTRGIRTTSGSRVFEHYIPDNDAAAWERLREAGAVLLGKTGMYEFAYGPTGENPHYGTPRNPWKLDCLPGGSSSGSGTAVAAGQAAMAMGSDTGGSIRIPAALCGVVGLKATYGRVSRYGATPLSWSQDHIGPLTRTVEDAALVLQALAGHDPRDPASSTRPVPNYAAALRQGVRGLRIGVPREGFWAPIDPEVDAAVRQAIAVLQDLGATVEEVSLPHTVHSGAASRVVISAEATTFHRDLLRQHGALYDASVKARLEMGLFITSRDYLVAQRVRARIRQEQEEALQRVDVLATPTETIPAPPIGSRQVRAGEGTVDIRDALLQCTRPFNLSGLPAIAVPCGFTREGLPISLQLAGRAFDEATVLRAAHAYEQATEWHTRRPPL